MPPVYTVRAQVIDIRRDTPRPTDALFFLGRYYRGFSYIGFFPLSDLAAPELVLILRNERPLDASVLGELFIALATDYRRMTNGPQTRRYTCRRGIDHRAVQRSLRRHRTICERCDRVFQSRAKSDGVL